MDNLEEVIPILTKISEELIISGLNIHSYNILLLSEALSFYEEVSKYIYIWINNHTNIIIISYY